MLTRLLMVWTLLALLIAAGLNQGGWEAWQPPKPIAPELGQAGNAVPGMSSSGMDEALRRPPFWPSRRPEVNAPAASHASLEGVRLLGLVMSSEETVVIFERGGELGRLSVGEELQGHKLLGIEQGSAVMQREGSEPVLIPMPRMRTDELPVRSGQR